MIVCEEDLRYLSQTWHGLLYQVSEAWTCPWASGQGDTFDSARVAQSGVCMASALLNPCVAELHQDYDRVLLSTSSRCTTCI